MLMFQWGRIAMTENSGEGESSMNILWIKTPPDKPWGEGGNLVIYLLPVSLKGQLDSADS